jgi:hypothetical protein
MALFFLLIYGAGIFYQSMALFFTILWRCFFTTESDQIGDIEEMQLCFPDIRAGLLCVHYSLIVNLN